MIRVNRFRIENVHALITTIQKYGFRSCIPLIFVYKNEFVNKILHTEFRAEVVKIKGTERHAQEWDLA